MIHDTTNGTFKRHAGGGIWLIGALPQALTRRRVSEGSGERDPNGSCKTLYNKDVDGLGVRRGVWWAGFESAGRFRHVGFRLARFPAFLRIGYSLARPRSRAIGCRGTVTARHREGTGVQVNRLRTVHLVQERVTVERTSPTSLGVYCESPDKE